ncbi:MAG: hypothetical protein J6J54_05645 [Bacteroidales bacterium]|nr:hypothetical protein [Bacteroidales bacterium]
MLTMRSIFQCMMEGGYRPSYEKNHILFNIEDNIGVVEYEEGILSVRIFFSIEEGTSELFLVASNAAMSETFIVKPVILEDMKSIMFSCEFFCDTVRQLRKYLPRSIELVNEALDAHKTEMKNLILADSLTSKAMPARDDLFEGQTSVRSKMLS